MEGRMLHFGMTLTADIDIQYIIIYTHAVMLVITSYISN